MCPELGERSAADRVPRSRGESVNEPQIMQREKTKTEDVLLVDEVADIRAGESGARGAATIVLQRTGIPGVASVADVHPAESRQSRAGPRHPGREHAVEHVDSAGDDAEDSLHVTEAHEVARPV